MNNSWLIWIFAVLVWLIDGIVMLRSKENPTKTEYLICWFTLMINLIGSLFRHSYISWMIGRL